MRRLLALAAFSAVALAASILPTAAADARFIRCPSEASSMVTHNGESEWFATNQSSRVVSARVEQVGGQPALACIYRMFGGDYWIYRRPDPGYTRCTIQNAFPGTQTFYCLRG